MESGVSFPWKPSTLRLEFPGIPPPPNILIEFYAVASSLLLSVITVKLSREQPTVIINTLRAATYLAWQGESEHQTRIKGGETKQPGQPSGPAHGSPHSLVFPSELQLWTHRGFSGGRGLSYSAVFHLAPSPGEDRLCTAVGTEFSTVC